MPEVERDDAAADIWAAYATAVAGLADVVANTTVELDEVNRAAGLRHLTRALYMGMISVHDYASVTAPVVFLAKTPTLLSGGTTSDCIYHEVFFDGARRYRLSATRGSAPLLEMTANTGKVGVVDHADMVDSIREDTLVLEPGGDRFEVILSPDPKPEGFAGNWMWTDNPERGTATWMLIREYSTTIRDVEPARWHIEPLDDAAHRPAPTLAEVDEALGASVAFAKTLIGHWTAMTAGMITGLANEFMIVDRAQAASDAMPTGHRFATAGFHLSPDEAWVVTIPGIGAAPYDAAPYWGFQLCNYWFEPIDYGDHWAHVNKDTAVYGPDGSVRIVVSEQRPAAGHDENWVQLRGYTMGNAQFRLSRIADPLPEIRCEVAAVASLAEGNRSG